MSGATSKTSIGEETETAGASVLTSSKWSVISVLTTALISIPDQCILISTVTAFVSLTSKTAQTQSARVLARTKTNILSTMRIPNSVNVFLCTRKTKTQNVNMTVLLKIPTLSLTIT